MVIAQWILEITDILKNKIVSFLKKSVIKKKFARLRRAKFFLPPQSQNRSYGLEAYSILVVLLLLFRCGDIEMNMTMQIRLNRTLTL